MKYVGNNRKFAAALDVVLACSSGRFRSWDDHNRRKYRLTATLLDKLSDNSNSLKLRERHHRALYLTTVKLGRADVLKLEDME